MKTSSPFQFSPQEIEDIKDALKTYFSDELDTEISNMQADLFIEFLNTKIGKYYYNVGIVNAIKEMKQKTDDLVLLIKE
ncbi:MAG TPA: DUF2164 family protein [Vitreimonas sp.]|nr:DUF2164 family protein [Vitreimonas sp.]